MKYVVIFVNTQDKKYQRIGPYKSRKLAERAMKKIHPSWQPVISEERATVPEYCTKPAPMVYECQYALMEQNKMNAIINFVYKTLRLERKTKVIWEVAKE